MYYFSSFFLLQLIFLSFVSPLQLPSLQFAFFFFFFSFLSVYTCNNKDRWVRFSTISFVLSQHTSSFLQYVSLSSVPLRPLSLPSLALGFWWWFLSWVSVAMGFRWRCQSRVSVRFGFWVVCGRSWLSVAMLILIFCWFWVSVSLSHSSLAMGF